MTDTERAIETIAALRANIELVVRGKPDVIKLCCVALLARGHLLLEDVPGVGKTTLARALARSIHGSFRRIQFTADLLPSDILGVSIFDPERREFEFRPGPIFANVVLADELNRAMPKTQGALLEAMNECQVSIDGQTRRIETPFIVIATENPVDHEGTFALPESQLDRFMMRLPLGYPSPEAERQIVRQEAGATLADRLQPTLDRDDVARLQAEADEITCSETLVDYLLALINATRHDPELRLGVSPRGAQVLLRAARACALIAGRDYVLPEDIQELVVPVLAHRVVLADDLAGGDVERQVMVIRRLLAAVPVPA